MSSLVISRSQQEDVVEPWSVGSHNELLSLDLPPRSAEMLKGGAIHTASCVERSKTAWKVNGICPIVARYLEFLQQSGLGGLDAPVPQPVVLLGGVRNVKGFGPRSRGITSKVTDSTHIQFVRARPRGTYRSDDYSIVCRAPVDSHAFALCGAKRQRVSIVITKDLKIKLRVRISHLAPGQGAKARANASYKRNSWIA